MSTEKSEKRRNGTGINETIDCGELKRADRHLGEKCEKKVTAILQRQEVLISDVDGSASIFLA